MDDSGEKEKRTTRFEVIAMPPLRMILVRAKDKNVSKAALAAVIKKIALQSITVKDDVEPQMIRKIIQHLEKKS